MSSLSKAFPLKITCDLTGAVLELAAPPRRVVSLLSSATETMVRLGAGDRVVGMSKYCPRYVRADLAPVVGEYLRADVAAIKALAPEVVLVTGGVQGGFARQLAKAGLPVYGMPLPDSGYAICDNTIRLGALLGLPAEGRALARELAEGMHRMRASSPAPLAPVYVELWFGRHMRTIGARSFIRDIFEMAGADPLFGDEPRGYFKPDLAAVAAARPARIHVFSEEDDHPVDGATLARERGWAGRWPYRLTESGIAGGRNIIHDGPSFLETAAWLRERLFGAGNLPGGGVKGVATD